MKLISGTAHRALAERIAQNIGQPLADVQVNAFPDGETCQPRKAADMSIQEKIDLLQKALLARKIPDALYERVRNEWLRLVEKAKETNQVSREVDGVVSTIKKGGLKGPDQVVAVLE